MALFEGERMIKRESRPTNREGARDWMLSQVVSIARQWQVEAPFERCGIGFGGPVDFGEQRMAFSTHVGGWNNFRLSEFLSRELGVPALMDNDANAGALAEATFGAGKGHSPLFYMTLSTGIGGGILLSPILALHFGIPIRQAIGTSLVAVITTSAASSSVHLQRHTTDIRLGMTLELATAFGAAVTAYLVGYFNRNALEGIFAGFLLYSSVTILLRRGKVKDQEEAPANNNGETVIPPYEPQRYPLGLAASLVAGGLSGLLGIGGGPIKVPVMYIFMNVPLMVATATSNFMIGVTAAASAVVYYRRGDILVEIAAPLAVGVFLGSLLGARLAPRIQTKFVVYLLVGIMLYLAGHLCVHLFMGVAT